MTSTQEWQRRLIALINAQIDRRAQSSETAMRQEAGRIATGTVSSATIGLGQLAQGGATANQVLAWNSGASEWQPATNLALISSQTLGAAATNIDFSSIPSTYTHLRVVMQGQIDANTADPVFLYFNADYTDANYQSRYELTVGSSAQNEPRLGLWSGGTRAGGSTFANDLDIRLPFYSNTSLVKRAWSEINYYDDNQSGDLVLGRGYVFHSGAANTNAVSAIRLSAGANQFISGTVAELYGVL
jgi:hypothetical protein